MLPAESAMPKALIDTNVLLAACYGRRPWQSSLLTAWLGGHFDWVTSEAACAWSSPLSSLSLCAGGEARASKSASAYKLAALEIPSSVVREGCYKSLHRCETA